MADILEGIAATCSPFPLVNINAPTVPNDGQHYPTPKICSKVFPRGECERFYRSLLRAEGRHQCPYGFSAWPIRIGTARLAVTGVIGAPRLGGNDERLRAKEYPANRIAAEAVPVWAERIAAIVTDGEKDREKEFARRLEALHEIRRFNQIIKTNMERACNSSSTTKDPDDAPVELVRAFRASALISVQLDALDLLANPSSMTFNPGRLVFYKTVDKIVRIYRIIADNRNVRMRLSGYSVSQALLDQRTIHIIPSVFVDNAIKYSESGGAVEVHVCDETREGKPVITLEVRSEGPIATPAEVQNLFVRRGRGEAARAVAEGSGIGLSLAKVVADQHRGSISVVQRPLSNGRADWKFQFQVPRI